MNSSKTFILNQLKKEAQERDAKTQLLVKSLAKKLVTNLSSSMGVGGGPTSPQPQPQELFPKDLKNIGALLMYLSANQIEWQDQLIAITSIATAAQNPESLKMDLKFSDLTISSGDRDQKSRKFDQGTFFANKAALSGYLNYLKNKSVKDKNKVLEVMIGKLVDQANRFLDPIDQIKDDVVGPNGWLLDAFTDKYFEAKDPLGTGGVNPVATVAKSYPIVPDGLFASKLYSKDLASPSAFNNWFYANILSVTTKTGETLNAQDTGKDSACLFLSSLVLRAKYYTGVSRSAQATEASKFYTSNLDKLLSQLDCPIDSSLSKTDSDVNELDAFVSKKLVSSKEELDGVIASFPKLDNLKPILTKGDLSSPKAFESWLKASGTDASEDICQSLKSLYGRVKYYSSVQKKSTEFTKALSVYKQLLETLSSSIKTSDGQVCSLVDGSSSVGEQTTTTKKDKDSSSGGVTIQQKANALSQVKRLLATMPLEESQIDYERIMDFYKNLDSFYEVFSSISGNVVNTQSEMAVDQIIGRSIRYGDAQGWRNKTYSLTNDPMSTIETIISFQMSKNWTLPFLGFNRQLVNLIMSDLNSLRSNVSSWYEREKDPGIFTALTEAINKQIGGGKSSSGGVGQRNVFALDSTMQKARVILGATR